MFFSEEKIHWDDVEGWLSEILAEEFHIDAQDGSPEHVSLHTQHQRATKSDNTTCIAGPGYLGKWHAGYTPHEAHRSPEHNLITILIDILFVSLPDRSSPLYPVQRYL